MSDLPNDNLGPHSASKETKDGASVVNLGLSTIAAASGKESAAQASGHNSIAANSGADGEAKTTLPRSVSATSGRRSTANDKGDGGVAVVTGDDSHAISGGTYATALAAGDFSDASVHGSDSIAIAAGVGTKARGSVGAWLVLAERKSNLDLVDVKAVQVDGKTILADTYYTLRDGTVVEA